MCYVMPLELHKRVDKNDESLLVNALLLLLHLCTHGTALSAMVVSCAFTLLRGFISKLQYLLMRPISISFVL